MKKIVFIILAGVLFYIIFGCQTQNKSTADAGDAMELSVEQGEYWQGKMKVMFFSVKKTPQLAAWIEDENGQYVATLAVTNRSAKGKWRSAPKEGRPEALPVWNHRQQNNGPADIDAASTATPKSSFEAKIDKDPLTGGNTYSVYLEINHSFDYNEVWTESNSGVNGQPSAIYHGQFIAGNPAKIVLKPVGHGIVDGSGGEIIHEMESLTSAWGIIKNASLTVK